MSAVTGMFGSGGGALDNLLCHERSFMETQSQSLDASPPYSQRRSSLSSVDAMVGAPFARTKRLSGVCSADRKSLTKRRRKLDFDAAWGGRDVEEEGEDQGAGAPLSETAPGKENHASSKAKEGTKEVVLVWSAKRKRSPLRPRRFK